MQVLDQVMDLVQVFDQIQSRYQTVSSPESKMSGGRVIEAPKLCPLSLIDILPSFLYGKMLTIRMNEAQYTLKKEYNFEDDINQIMS